MGLKKLFLFIFSIFLLIGVTFFLSSQTEAATDISPFATDALQAVAAPQGFQDSVVFSGLNTPMAVRFAPNGKVFVAEKSGIIKVFDSLTDTSATVFANLSSQVNDYWDRGMMSLAVDPNFPTNPYIYVAYAYDAPPGQAAPYWNDNCADANGAGCLITNRVSRLTVNGDAMVAGSEKILISDYCSQFPSHVIGDLQFANDGSLYVTGGEGANFNYADYGQTGNPCNDPVNEGGALRSQDLMTTGDPVGLGGTLIRIDPSTGNASPGNPLIGGARTDDDRILAYGLRNPFRFAKHPTTEEIWIGNVGWGRWEAIDRVQNPTSSVKNFGWPCFEGTDRTQGYSTLDLPICQTLYSNNTVIPPYYQYIHQGSSAISALAFYNGNTYPSQYKNALFMADYAAGWLKVMFPNPTTQLPDTNNIITFAEGVYITDLQPGPDGDIFYVSIATGEIHRIQYFSTNTPPVAQASANRTHGPAPLTIQFNASTSYDPDLDTISYSWDFNGDGVYGESTSATATYTYNIEGIYNASVRVTDSRGAFNNANLVISVGNAPVPRITLPATTETYQVGDSIKFAGDATEANNNFLPSSALSWQTIIHHCALSNPTDCHDHFFQAFDGVSAGTIIAPDHEYPSYLEFRLTAKQDGFPAGWWNTSWLYRKKLTFNASGVTSAITNMPVLVTLTPSNIDYTKAGTGGNALRFVDRNNNLLSYEIEQWNNNGTSTIWVKVPSISTTDNFMWLYYGNATAPSAQNKTAVWSDGYRGVWHLNNTTIDSTSNALNGTSTNSTAATGRISGGRAFNGTNARVAVNHSSLLSFSNSQSFTMGAWVNYTTKTGTKGVITKSRNTTTSWYGLTINSSNRWIFGGPRSITGPTVASGWNYVQLVQNGPSRTRTMYVNGVQVATGTSQTGTGTGPLWFGGSNGFNEWFQGTLDEISIAGSSRSAQWVQTNYRSVNNNLITFAAEETKTTLTGTTSVSIQPETTTMTFRTNPPGLSVSAYSTSRTAPFTTEAVVGAVVSISAPQTQTVNGVQYTFQSWSDGGARDHFITAPEADQTYTATYTANVPAGTTVWNSYDTQVSTTGSKGTINDITGTKSAVLDFYVSANDDGVTPGIPFTQYTAGNHIEAHQLVNTFHSFVAGGGDVYAGKSTIRRGNDSNESNSPSPLGVIDLQLHPPDDFKLIVAAFTVPESGNYTVSNLGMRRIDPTSGQTAQLKLFNSSRILLTTLMATSQSWTLDSSTFNLGALNAGDKIYFAVDSDGRNWWDGIETAWTITKTGGITQPAPTINSFTADPATILSDQQSTLSWNVSDATNVTIDNGVGTVAASGTTQVSPTTTTTYTITATNATGSTNQAATVTISASPGSTLEWNSQDVTPTGLNSSATVNDTTETVSANVEFYKSVNIGGIDKGLLFTQYTAGNHIEAHQKVKTFYSFDPEGGHPYAGKSTVGRGSDSGESNTPSPLSVMDLQLHPPDDERTTVAEFSAPRTGTYVISDLAARRIDPMTDQLAEYRVYNNAKSLLVAIPANIPSVWTTNTQQFTLTLNQGDKIYFAVNALGRNWWDSIEIMWKIKLQN